MRTRLVIIGTFAAAMGLLIAVGYYRTWRKAEAQGPPVVKPAVVRCEPLREQQYEVVETFYGLIQARTRVDLAFQIPGRIAQLGPSVEQRLKENQVVNPGDVLAMIEPLRYEAMVEQAKAGRQEALAARAAAEAEIARAEAALDDAKRETQRVRELVERNAGTRRELERVEVAQRMAQAAVDGAHARLSSAAAAYEAAQAAATTAQVNLADATLRAPLCAKVAVVSAEIGQMVQPGQPVISLVDTTRVKLLLGVVESRLPLLRPGQPVRVEVRALSSEAAALRDDPQLQRVREGVVSVVPPAADPMTGLFNVEVELDNADGQLRPGMIGKATVTVATRRAVAIPSESVIREGDRLYAFFAAEGYDVGLDLGDLGSTAVSVPASIARRLPIKPITQLKGHYLVESLPPDVSRLVVEGQTRLADGQPITVIESLASVPPPFSGP